VVARALEDIRRAYIRALEVIDPQPTAHQVAKQCGLVAKHIRAAREALWLHPDLYDVLELTDEIDVMENVERKARAGEKKFKNAKKHRLPWTGSAERRHPENTYLVRQSADLWRSLQLRITISPSSPFVRFCGEVLAVIAKSGRSPEAVKKLVEASMRR
jgi:hypothetical protein